MKAIDCMVLRPTTTHRTNHTNSGILGTKRKSEHDKTQNSSIPATTKLTYHRRRIRIGLDHGLRVLIVAIRQKDEREARQQFGPEKAKEIERRADRRRVGRIPGIRGQRCTDQKFAPKVQDEKTLGAKMGENTRYFSGSSTKT
jgi:hypothetical protein